MVMSNGSVADGERIGVRGRAEQVERRPLRDVEAVDRDVLHRPARRPDHRRVPADHLLDRAAAQLRVLRQEAPLVGPLDEELQRQAELVLGRVHPAEHDQRDHRPQLGVRERGRAVVRRDQGGDDVVARRPPALGDHVGQAVHVRQAGLDAVPVLGDRDAEREADVGRPVREVAPAALVEADQPAQHPGRVRLGELGHEVAPAAGGERVDELGGEQPEARHHLLHERPREGRVGEAAQAAVVVALGAQHEQRPPVVQETLGDAVLGGPGEAALAQAPVLQEQARLLVAQHGEAEVRAGVPAALARGQDVGRRHREVGVGDVEVGHIGDGSHAGHRKRCLGT